ncbi:MAG: radical SAM protein [Methanotrichaceae archaeon]|nr:radical SAM protein [Methanotrichaceae archaeon]
MSGNYKGSLVQSDSFTILREPTEAKSNNVDIAAIGMQQTIIDKTVSSLCPICLKIVQAHIFEETGKVFMEKYCEDHGDFREIYWSDASLYKKFFKYLTIGHESDSSAAEQIGCTLDCGLCKNHITSTLLGIVDLTSRCNMTCPICFADAGGDQYEPSLDQIKIMLQNLRAEEPVPCPAIQFSGGEPTLRDDLPQIVAMARQMGFAQIQIATNGLRLASNFNLCKALQRNGLNTIYLQFDGVTSEPYLALRGQDYLPIKLKAIENFKKANQTSVILVPTLVKDVNDHQVGDIVRFASKNSNVIKGINFQPVAFAGRIDSKDKEREKKRITIPDLFSLIEKQTNNDITKDDFYPVSFVVPISQLIAAKCGFPQPSFTVHPCCGAATYVYKSNGRLIPITRFIDVEGLLENLKYEVENYDGSRFGKLKMKGRILRDLPSFVDDNHAPADLNITRMLLGVFRNGTRESIREFHLNSLFVGVMHFQDVYNIDLERLQRCGVHYSLPNGKIIPFCAYNTIHRLKNNFLKD